MKKQLTFLTLAMLGLSLAGCAQGGQLPEDDFKIVRQNVSGMVEVLLNSGSYGSDQSTLTSMVLPVGDVYQLDIHLEQYEEGTLIHHETLLTYETNTLTKDSIIHLIINAGIDDEYSRLTVAEVDLTNTPDRQNPEYKTQVIPFVAIEFNHRQEIEHFDGDETEEVTLVAYAKGDSQTPSLDLTPSTYASWEKVTLIKLNVTKK